MPLLLILFQHLVAYLVNFFAIVDAIEASHSASIVAIRAWHAAIDASLYVVLRNLLAATEASIKLRCPF